MAPNHKIFLMSFTGTITPSKLELTTCSYSACELQWYRLCASVSVSCYNTMQRQYIVAREEL